MLAAALQTLRHPKAIRKMMVSVSPLCRIVLRALSYLSTTRFVGAAHKCRRPYAFGLAGEIRFPVRRLDLA